MEATACGLCRSIFAPFLSRRCCTRIRRKFSFRGQHRRKLRFSVFVYCLAVMAHRRQLSPTINLCFVRNHFRHFLIRMKSSTYVLHLTTHLQNGLAKRFIRSTKDGLNKNTCHAFQMRLDSTLLIYRNTAHATTSETPAHSCWVDH